jgi:hypothetical protein
MPTTSADFTNHVADEVSGIETFKEDGFSGLSQDELFENYKIKKLLDNGLILQGEYDLSRKKY